MVISVACILLAAGVAVIARDWYVARYQPIVVGNGSFFLEVSGVPRREIRQVDTHAIGNEPKWITRVPFRKGSLLRMVFPIFHDGDRPIRITDVRFGPPPTYIETVLEPVEVEVGSQINPRANSSVSERNTRLFTPFTLLPESNPVLELTYRFVCQRGGRGAMEIRDTFTMRFELLGGSRWVELVLPWRLVIEGPTREECPPGSGVFERAA